MGRFERSIKIAFDKKSGEILEADQVFDTPKHGFEVRRQFHKDEVELSCCECEQKLNVSTSKYDRLHFKHEPNHKPCTLTDGNLSPKEIEEFNRIFLAKESDRHKQLKNAIAERLRKTEGVDTGSIAIDDKFITIGSEKRRPDVYCKYLDKQLVFEIQLSNLSLRYILSRHEFYQKNGFYLIWILDNFNIHQQSQMVRDIKYLTSYENFFKLDETVTDFQLFCEYKTPYITQSSQVHTKWINKSVTLTEIHFDEEKFEIYYYNFNSEKNEREKELAKLITPQKETEQALTRQAKENSAKIAAKQIIAVIKQTRQSGWSTFDEAKYLINQLDSFEIDILNKELNLKPSGDDNKPAINRWINTAKRSDDYGFLNFILGCEAIYLNVNDTDLLGTTCLQELYANTQLLSQFYVMICLLKRGYEITSEDKKLLETIYPKPSSYEPVIYLACSRLSNLSLIDQIQRNTSLICILESARCKQIVGFNYKPDQWAAFAINAIQHYTKYWEYIELAFKKYGLWDNLIQADRKGTFQKKINTYYEKMPEQQYDTDTLFAELYPDLIQ